MLGTLSFFDNPRFSTLMWSAGEGTSITSSEAAPSMLPGHFSFTDASPCDTQPKGCCVGVVKWRCYVDCMQQPAQPGMQQIVQAVHSLGVRGLFSIQADSAAMSITGAQVRDHTLFKCRGSTQRGETS